MSTDKFSLTSTEKIEMSMKKDLYLMRGVINVIKPTVTQKMTITMVKEITSVNVAIALETFMKMMTTTNGLVKIRKY